jgi:oxysterol-binding protein-related protein 9/10/11
VTDDESGNEGVVLTDEHNTLLKLASQTKRGTDLTRITLPTFLIEPKSFLEVLANFWNHTNLFIKYGFHFLEFSEHFNTYFRMFYSIANQSEPKTRMLALVKWYLTSFCAGLKMHLGKKPMTPIVGETFLCSWKVQEGKKPHLVHFVAEQVHNQPPGLLLK